MRFVDLEDRLPGYPGLDLRPCLSMTFGTGVILRSLDSDSCCLAGHSCRLQL